MLRQIAAFLQNQLDRPFLGLLSKCGIHTEQTGIRMRGVVRIDRVAQAVLLADALKQAG